MLAIINIFFELQIKKSAKGVFIESENNLTKNKVKIENYFLKCLQNVIFFE